jgi:hypothetical protein
MRRISSLPTAEFCPKVDRIGLDVETTQSARSTIFHEYCDTGVWPKDLNTLPTADREEISKWRVPMPFVYRVGDVTHALQYKNAYRETRVALDKDFNFVPISLDIPQSEIATRHPEAMVVGHLDMAWDIEGHDLVIVSDIKSSIYAVKEGCDSLQLHGYGIALAKFLKRGRYLTSIWDASEGKYHVSPNAVEMDGFEVAGIMDRIRIAATERDGNFRVGSHCSHCWKRSHCPAHLVDVPEGEFKAILSGQATEADVREAIIKKKQIADLQKRVDDGIKAWVRQHGHVRSEDGKRIFRCELRANNVSLDEKAVCASLGVENLDGFKRSRGEHEHFDWRKAD